MISDAIKHPIHLRSQRRIDYFWVVLLSLVFGRKDYYFFSVAGHRGKDGKREIRIHHRRRYWWGKEICIGNQKVDRIIRG